MWEVAKAIGWQLNHNTLSVIFHIHINDICCKHTFYYNFAVIIICINQNITANVLIKSADCKIVLTGLEGDNVILMQISVNVRIDCMRQMDKEIVKDAFLANTIWYFAHNLIISIKNTKHFHIDNALNFKLFWRIYG